MRHVKLSCGFEADLDETCVQNDMELLDWITEADQGNGMALSKLASRLLGDQKPALYDALRGDNGKVAPARVRKAVIEIFEAFGEKNS